MTTSMLFKRFFHKINLTKKKSASFAIRQFSSHEPIEVTKKSHRDIDWNRVLANTTAENQDIVLKARSRHADLQAAITEAKEQPQEIDFEYFRERNVDESLIAKVQDAFTSYKHHKMDITERIAKIQKDRAKAAEHSAEYLVKLESELKEKEAKLETVKAAKAPEEITVDDIYEMHPEWKEQIMEGIKRDQWGTSIKDIEIYVEELKREKEGKSVIEDTKH